MKESLFFHGLWRSRSTYWFGLFRNKICAYNEPLHPLLANMPLDDLVSQEQKASLRHPVLEKNMFAEFPSSLSYDADLGDVPFALNPKESHEQLYNYISQLKDAASKNQSAFFMTRSSFRGAWFREHFGGTHIYLERDTPSLLRSYNSFRGSLSWYLTSLFTIVARNANHPAFKGMADYLNLSKVDGSYGVAFEKVRRLKNERFKQKQYTEQTKIDLVSFFHDVSLAHAQSYADLIISLEKENQFDLKEVEQQVINITQIPIGLADYQFKSPAKPVQQSMVVSGFVADANNYLSYK